RRRERLGVAKEVSWRGLSIWAASVRRGGELTPRGGAMRYALLICTDESAMQAASPEEAQASLAEYGAWVEEMGKRGVLQGGERLRPTTDATTVQVRDGETLTSDGPFAETKEQIGGVLPLHCQHPRPAPQLAAQPPGP